MTKEKEKKNKGGRPTMWNEFIIKKTNQYLEDNKKEYENIIERFKDGEGKETVLMNRIKVNLPSIAGLSRYLDVSRETIYEWKELHKEFSYTLGKILAEQEKRLIENGLAGNYNSTIAKLILSSNHGYKEKSDLTSDNKKIEPITAINYIKPNGTNDNTNN